MPGWTLEDIPPLRGRTAVVTGGNTGLGFRSVRELARSGARVILSSRSAASGGRVEGGVVNDFEHPTAAAATHRRKRCPQGSAQEAQPARF